MIDLHAHILPGLDDGPATMDESLDLCRLLLREGVTNVVATPHMFDGVHEVPPEAIREGVLRLRRELAAANLPLHVLPGADIRIDPRALEAARAGRLMTFGARQAYAILEFPPDVIPPGVERFLFDLWMAGVTPLLSHPERSEEMQRGLGLLRRLVEKGCLVQVSAPSLTGGFGKNVLRMARRMVREGLVHVLASDCHGVRRRPPRLQEAFQEVAVLVGPAEAEAMVAGRPSAILAGDTLEGCTSVPDGGEPDAGLFLVGREIAGAELREPAVGARV